MTEEVLIGRRGSLGEIVLNRPKALNALNLDMIRAIHPALTGWAEDDGVKAVLIQGAGGRAFCSGGDVRSIMVAPPDSRAELQRSFFAEEYALNYAISTFPKPFIALMDGITMGGGCGLSIHGSHRIVSERTSLAMPETVLGLFPDVGASFFLNRLPGESGTYLALTGHRIAAGDCCLLGLATQYVPEDRHEGMITALSRLDDSRREIVDGVLVDFAAPAPQAPMRALLQEVDRIFAGDDVQAIMDRLQTAGADWTEAALSVFRRASPTSLKLTLRLLRRNAGLELAEALRHEYRLSIRCCAGHDFPEGVRAILIDKDQSPRWQPSTLAEVDDAAIEAMFDPLGSGDISLK